MNAGALIARLEAFAEVLPRAVRCLSEPDSRWKPPSGAWSVLEIVCHLGDEEVDDFRARLRSTLEDLTRPWPEINPEDWARGRCYNELDLTEAVRRFVAERQVSIRWLRGLASPDWNRAHVHPKFGPISAGTLLASWAAHDALHLRQIAKRLWELAGRDAGSFKVEYAGEWRA